jgi:hypothetical protein
VAGEPGIRGRPWSVLLGVLHRVLPEIGKWCKNFKILLKFQKFMRSVCRGRKRGAAPFWGYPRPRATVRFATHPRGYPASLLRCNTI